MVSSTETGGPMSCGSIRRLTGAERAAREERDAELFQEMRAEVEEEMRQEWERDFGPTFKAKYPFNPHSEEIDKITYQRLRANP